MSDLQKFIKLIDNTKKKLNGKPAKENFGDSEVQKLKTELKKFNIHTDDDGKKAYEYFKKFEDWTISYTGLKEFKTFTQIKRTLSEKAYALIEESSQKTYEDKIRDVFKKWTKSVRSNKVLGTVNLKSIKLNGNAATLKISGTGISDNFKKFIEKRGLEIKSMKMDAKKAGKPVTYTLMVEVK